MSSRFIATHRMLVKATEEHNYETIEINIDNGLFRKTATKMTETKIRVNKSILGEVFSIGGKTKALGLDELDGVAKIFNEARVAAGYEVLEFRTTEEIKKKRVKNGKTIKDSSVLLSN